MTPTECAYLAGLIDGEGWIGISRTVTSASAKGCKRGAAYRAAVSITLTNRPLLKWVATTTQVGRISNKTAASDRHKTPWAWTVWSREAVALLHDIRPYLVLKAPQADNLIAFQKLMRFPGSKGLRDDEWSAREEHYATAKALNQRGAICLH